MNFLAQLRDRGLWNTWMESPVMDPDSAESPRRAIFELDRLIRSIYTLRYLRDPQLQHNVHRSHKRIESYHQLRAVIAPVAGKKELSGKTDIEITDQCARLVANAII